MLKPIRFYATAILISISPPASTEPVMRGEVTTATTEIVINADSKIAISMKAFENLTVYDLKVSRDVATFRLTGTGKAAVKWQFPHDSGESSCTYLFGKKTGNKMEVCFKEKMQSMQLANTNYYPYPSDRDWAIIGGSNNSDPTLTHITPDSYTMVLEAVQYTE